MRNYGFRMFARNDVLTPLFYTEVSAPSLPEAMQLVYERFVRPSAIELGRVELTEKA